MSADHVPPGEKRSHPTNQWNAELYDSRLGYVSKFGADLIELLAPQPGERILDLGCGTGDMAKRISDMGATVVGIDKSSTMIERAKVKYPHIDFEVADGEAFRFGEPFDAVFSNAALHWMTRPNRVIERVWSALKPGGRFVAEFGGHGNVGTIVSAIRQALDDAGYQQRQINPWYFPTIGEYASRLERQGFRVVIAAHFDRPTPLEGGWEGITDWVQMFAGDFFVEVPQEERLRIIRDAAVRMKDELFRDGTWVADYKRLRVVAVKARKA